MANLGALTPTVTTDVCGLCGNSAVLLQSHIIPAFVSDWLKRHSGTGYLRSIDNPNRRRQDFWKERLLCASCEQVLSRHEKEFSERIFIPYLEDGQESFTYEEWLRYFAVSLAWRNTYMWFRSYGDEHPTLRPYAEEALHVWATYLLGQSTHPGDYEHHMFFLDVVKSATDIKLVPKGMQRYSLTAVDVTIAMNETQTELYSYVKLPRIIFWSAIHPPKAWGWNETLIYKWGTIRSPQRIGPNGFAEFLADRVEKVERSMSAMSARQREKISTTAREDLDRMAHSNSFAALLAEDYWDQIREASLHES